MSVFSPTLRAVPALILIAAALSACGGGGGGGADQPPVVFPAVSAQPDVVLAALNTGTTLPVLANDSVTNGGTLKLVSTTVPAHGSATISGDKIVYVPAAGYIGKDSFSYTTKDIGSGTATSSADVSVTVSASLILSGKTVDVPGNATLTIAIGDKTTVSSTDVNGNFGVPVVLDTPASMITITAQGTGAKSFIKLVSVVGDSQLAVKTAGVYTTLTPGDLPGLTVTAISTALYAQAVYKNGGTAPATQAAWDGVLGQVYLDELLQSAAIIRSLTGKAGAAPLRTLPANIADTLALVSNSAANALFIKGITEPVIYPEMQAFNKDVADMGGVPAVLPSAAKSLTFFHNTTCCPYFAVEMVLQPDGSGSFSRAQKRYAGTWRKDTALRMTLATPEIRAAKLQLPTNFALVDVQYITRDITMRQFSGTAEHGFASLSSSGTLHYVHGELPDAPFSTDEVYAFSDWSSLTVPADLGGAALAGVPKLDAIPVDTVAQMIMAFGADGSASSPQLAGAPLAWKIQDGKLLLTLGSLPAQTLGRVSVSPNGDETWLVRGSSGADYAVYGAVMVRPQAGLAFTEENAVQRWFLTKAGTFVGTRSFYTVRADHTSGAGSLHMDGSIGGGGATGWKIENGTLVQRAYRANTGGIVSVCPPAVSCTLYSEQIWTMLRNDPDSIVVLEDYMITPGVVLHRVMRYFRD